MTNVRQSYATVPWWPARHVIGRSRSLTSGDIAFAPTAWCGTTSAAVASTGSTRSFEIVVGVSHATLGQDLGQDRATSSCLCAPYVGIYGTHRFTFNVAQSLYMRLPIGTDPIVRITADPIRRATPRLSLVIARLSHRVTSCMNVQVGVGPPRLCLDRLTTYTECILAYATPPRSTSSDMTSVWPAAASPSRADRRRGSITGPPPVAGGTAPPWRAARRRASSRRLQASCSRPQGRSRRSRRAGPPATPFPSESRWA
jgi:hypothetical protein